MLPLPTSKTGTRPNGNSFACAGKQPLLGESRSVASRRNAAKKVRHSANTSRALLRRASELAEALEQVLRHRSRFAVADGAAIETNDGDHLGCRSGEEALVGRV